MHSRVTGSSSGASPTRTRAPAVNDRGLGLNNVFVFHKGTDIPKDSPGQTVISEAQSIYVFRQDRKDDADWAVRTFGFDPSTAEVLQTLQPGHFVFKYGSVPETHVQHVRSDIEVTLTDTDEGMRGDARKVQ